MSLVSAILHLQHSTTLGKTLNKLRLTFFIQRF